MKVLEHVIKDEYSLHARPASQLAKLCQGFDSSVTLSVAEKSADLKRIFAVMALGVKQNDTIVIRIAGKDEEEACKKIASFIADNNI